MLGDVISHSGYGGGCWKHGEEKEEKDLLLKLFLRKVNKYVCRPSPPPTFFFLYLQRKFTLFPAAFVIEKSLFLTISKFFIIYFIVASFIKGRALFSWYPFRLYVSFLLYCAFRLACSFFSSFTFPLSRPRSHKGRFNCSIPVLGTIPVTTCIKCSCRAANASSMKKTSTFQRLNHVSILKTFFFLEGKHGLGVSERSSILFIFGNIINCYME